MSEPTLPTLPPNDGEVRVSFSLVDFLDRLKRDIFERFDKLERSLDNKADKSDVEDHERRLRAIKQDVDGLKTTAVTQRELRAERRRLWAAVGAILAAVVALVGLFEALHIHITL